MNQETNLKYNQSLKPEGSRTDFNQSSLFSSMEREKNPSVSHMRELNPFLPVLKKFILLFKSRLGPSTVLDFGDKLPLQLPVLVETNNNQVYK